jgi:hypothetical protein
MSGLTEYFNTWAPTLPLLRLRPNACKLLGLLNQLISSISVVLNTSKREMGLGRPG